MCYRYGEPVQARLAIDQNYSFNCFTLIPELVVTDSNCSFRAARDKSKSMAQLILDINILYIDLVSAGLSIMSGLWMECKFVIRFDTWRWISYWCLQVEQLIVKKRKSATKELIPNRLWQNVKPNLISHFPSERACSRSVQFWHHKYDVYAYIKDLAPTFNFCDHCTQWIYFSWIVWSPSKLLVE